MKKNILIILIIFSIIGLALSFCSGDGTTDGGNDDSNNAASNEEICQVMWDVCYSGLTGYEQESYFAECNEADFSGMEDCLVNATSCEEVEACYE